MGRTVAVVKYLIEKTVNGTDWTPAHNVVAEVGGEKVAFKDPNGIHELTPHEVQALRDHGLRVTVLKAEKGKK